MRNDFDVRLNDGKLNYGNVSVNVSLHVHLTDT